MAFEPFIKNLTSSLQSPLTESDLRSATRPTTASHGPVSPVQTLLNPSSSVGTSTASGPILSSAARSPVAPLTHAEVGHVSSATPGVVTPSPSMGMSSGRQEALAEIRRASELLRPTSAAVTIIDGVRQPQLTPLYPTRNAALLDARRIASAVDDSGEEREPPHVLLPSGFRIARGIPFIFPGEGGG